MRTKRRGSVNMEAVMVVPIAVVLILLGRFVLETSLNRQETAVFVRGSTIAAASASNPFLSCNFEREQFVDHPEVAQNARVWCYRRSAERGLSDERPMWDEVEDGAAPWDEILRDVKPRRGPRDINARGDVTLSMVRPAFLAQQNSRRATQRYLTPENVRWAHSERGYDSAHSAVIWDELCKEGTYWLFPNVFPKKGGPRC